MSFESSRNARFLVKNGNSFICTLTQYRITQAKDILIFNKPELNLNVLPYISKQTLWDAENDRYSGFCWLGLGDQSQNDKSTKLASKALVFLFVGKGNAPLHTF